MGSTQVCHLRSGGPFSDAWGIPIGHPRPWTPSLVARCVATGTVCVHTVLDCLGRYVWYGLYTAKMLMTAFRILKTQALPLSQEHAVTVETILSDNDREYCDRPDKHPAGL